MRRKLFVFFNSSLAVVIIFNLAFVLMGCKDAISATPVTEDEPSGDLKIFIPPYAPLLDDLFTGSLAFSSGTRSLNQTEPRAFAVANRVVLTVNDSSSGVVDTAEFTPGSFADEGLTLSMELPVGTGYTLDVEIYNTFESETEPTVTGTSASFDILENQTSEITVTCTPVLPTELTLGSAATAFSQTNYLIDADSSITATGGETWVSFTSPANGSVMFTVDIPEELAIGILLHDAQGLPASGLNSRQTDGAIYFTGLTGSALHYGLVIIADQNTATQVEQSFTLAAAQGYSISGTITVPGVTDVADLPGGGDEGPVFMIPTLTAQPSLGDMVSVIFLENPVVADGNLEYSYTMGYDGDETAVLASGIIADTANWPAEGDYFGVAPDNVGVDLDLLNMTGIEPHTFSGDMTGVNFELQLLEAPSGTVNVTIN